MPLISEQCKKRGDLLLDAFITGYDAINRQIVLNYQERMALAKKSGEELAPPIFFEKLDKAVKEGGASQETASQLRSSLIHSLEETRKPGKYWDISVIREFYNVSSRAIFSDLVSCECGNNKAGVN